ncbi:putative damage-inducible protein DinB [Pseudoduganella flava]|uniref:Damage-inducible protein DinB n=1 Tax=Pseudoduganella flava TaxID=871742 RepID=A0A562PHU1_9BURK|nr:DinB family protein [Pseudoduganella flava]QGZ40373.1 damage-inducible protein DinB [Pseudoduganella flava]TWI43566.1 putative damage-inducible protein DinB [Pseudoduganella flava]
MPTCQDLVLLAAYNADMNRKLYDAAAQLPAGELTADRGAFFGSLAGTMNHLLTADTIWLTRFTDHPAGFTALAPLRGQPAPTSLAHSFGTELPVLRAYRERLDGYITALAAELRPEHLETTFVYRSTKGIAFHKHFGSVLLHFFNHQTHHRGQASTLLTQAGVDIGVTDLLVIVPEVA